MYKLKKFIKYLLFIKIFFISTLNAEEKINFNLGISVNETILSEIDNNDYEKNLLNFEKYLNKKTIEKINFNIKSNSINKISNNKIIENRTDKKSLLKKLTDNFNKKETQLNWYNNSLNELDIQKRISEQDISISPTSINLPEGNGNAILGEKIYQAKCLSCHGTEGKAEQLDQRIESLRGGQNSLKIIAFESLSGGLGSLSSEMPIRSVGSFWPHATTLFDYIRRAMPYFEPQSLTNEESYAVTAYVLFINNIINKEYELNASSLQNINMPNKAGFIDSWGPDWWREWLHQKYNIIFTITLLLLIIIISISAQKLTKNKSIISNLKIFITSTILVWFGVFQSFQFGTQKVYSSYHELKINNGIWDNILFEPIFIILTSFIIISTLIWGRGIFCGWICPFGTIQDIMYKITKILKLNKFDIPDKIHHKLIYTKYIILLLMVSTTFYTTGNNLLLHIEPFETIFIHKFNTSTILILWTLTVLCFIFFIERGFCKYLCPTGAALALVTQLQVINWLIPNKSCNNKSCLACNPHCPTKAIKHDGSINEKECIQCLSCQIVFNDKNTVCINKKIKASIRKKIL